MANFGYKRVQDKSGLNVEVIIRDESMGKIEVLRCKGNEFYKIASILYRKYGIRYKPEVENPIGFKKDRDLEWSSPKQ